MPRLLISLTLGLPLAVTACVSPPRPNCTRGGQPAIQETLYFGTNKPDGDVTPADWARFLENTVTPRFPQGLTVSQAAGQWRGANGGVVRESTYVLHLIHPDDAQSDTSVREIMSYYKTVFQQQAVLRARAVTCASF